MKSNIRKSQDIDSMRIEILKGIQGKLRRGDLTRIAKKLNKSKEYVGMVLNPDHEYYNEIIVTEAVNLISEREQNTKKLLESLTSEQ